MATKNYDEETNVLIEELMSDRNVPVVEKLMEQDDAEIAAETIIVSFLTPPDKIDIQHTDDFNRLNYKIVRAIQEFLNKQPDTDLAYFQSVGVKQKALGFKVMSRAVEEMFS